MTRRWLPSAHMQPPAGPAGVRRGALGLARAGLGWGGLAPGGRQRETHIGREEEDDAVGGSLQRQASDEEDGQDDIGQRRSDIHGLGTGQAWGEGGDGAQEDTGLVAHLPPASHCRVCNGGYSAALVRQRLWTSLACSFLSPWGHTGGQQRPLPDSGHMAGPLRADEGTASSGPRSAPPPLEPMQPGLTLPVVSMPRMVHTYRTLQAQVRQSRTHHCTEPELLMSSEMLKVSRYQK